MLTDLPFLSFMNTGDGRLLLTFLSSFKGSAPEKLFFFSYTSFCKWYGFGPNFAFLEKFAALIDIFGVMSHSLDFNNPLEFDTFLPFYRSLRVTFAQLCLIFCFGKIFVVLLINFATLGKLCFFFNLWDIDSWATPSWLSFHFIAKQKPQVLLSSFLSFLSCHRVQ